MDHKETWAQVSAPFDKYEISTTGLCRNKTNGRILAPEKLSTGYLRYRLAGQFGPKKFLAHRLVAETFIPNVASITLVVNHKNGIRDDNSVSNLEWVSQKENMVHMANRIGPIPNRVLWKPVLQFDLNGVFIQRFDNAQMAAEFCENVSLTSSIRKCCRGERQAAGGFGWTYEQLPVIDSDGEIWKTIVVNERDIDVSNFGHIRTNGRIRSPATGDVGYKVVNILNRGYYVHKLVALAFLPKESNLEHSIVNHINEVKDDNRAENLEWTTPRGNSKHSGHKHNKPIVGTCVNSGEVRHFSSISEAAKELGASLGYLSAVLPCRWGHNIACGWSIEYEEVQANGTNLRIRR